MRRAVIRRVTRHAVRRAARGAVIDRRTTETRIALRLRLDGHGRYEVRTGIRFLDHMLELVARHGAFDLRVDARGDLDVDQHHTVEDLGIASPGDWTRQARAKLARVPDVGDDYPKAIDVRDLRRQLRSRIWLAAKK